MSVQPAPKGQQQSIVPIQPSAITLANPPSSQIQPFLQVPPIISKASLTSLTKEEKEAKQAVQQMPITIQNMDHTMQVLAEIDIRDHNTHQIITPVHLINYLDHKYGNVEFEILEPDALDKFEHSHLDLSTIPMDITTNTSLSFIALDESMAFLASNGTSPENLVIAENMVKDQTGFPVLISLNNDSEQNLDIIHSSDIQPISIPLDISANSSSVQVSDILTAIISKTQTLQINSPDFVTEPLSDESAHLYEFGFSFFSNLFKGVEKMMKKDLSIGYEKIFGAYPGEQILAMLKNPASIDPSFLSSLPLYQLPVLRGGLFQLVLHGAVLSEDFEYVDCTGFEHLSFVGPFGFSLLASDKFIHGSIREPVKLQTFARGQVASKNVCRIPKIRFTPNLSLDGSSHPFKLTHIDDSKNTQILLDNNDLIKLFGREPVPPHVVFNLVRFFGLRSDSPQRLDIVSCLDVPDVYRSVNYEKFALGKSPSGIPIKFHYKAELETVDRTVVEADRTQKMELDQAVQFHRDNVARIEANINNMHAAFFQQKLHAQNIAALPGAKRDLEKAQSALKAAQSVPVSKDGRFQVKMLEGVAKDAVCRLSPPSTYDRDKEQKELCKHIQSIKKLRVVYPDGRIEFWEPTPYEVEAAYRITRPEQFEILSYDWTRAALDYLRNSKLEGYKIVMPDISDKSPRPSPQLEAQQRAEECSALVERNQEQMISVNPNEGAIGYQIEKYLQDPLLIKNIIVTFKLVDGTLFKMSGLDYKILKMLNSNPRNIDNVNDMIRGNGFSENLDFSDFLPELVETFRQYREIFPDNSVIVMGGTFKKIFNELPRIKVQRLKVLEEQAAAKAAEDEAAYAKKAAEREEETRNPLPIGWRAEKQKDGKILYIQEVLKLKTYERPS
jgi:hypothetical protein